ncbi:MAG TPA: hypothetical protein VEH50_06555 [Methylomirabilota bacterium]|nr:hypothetical protein [Methylomirabilota bacterium]
MTKAVHEKFHRLEAEHWAKAALYMTPNDITEFERPPHKECL